MTQNPPPFSDWKPSTAAAFFVDDIENIHTADRRGIPVHTIQVKAAMALIDDSRVMPLIDFWLREDGYDPAKGGAKPLLDGRQALVLMTVLMLEGQPPRWKLVADMILFRLSKNARVLIGIHQPQHPHRDRVQKNWAENVRRAFLNRVLKPINPYPNTQYHRRYASGVRGLDDPSGKPRELRPAPDPVWVAKATARANRFQNQLVWASVRLFPEDAMSCWDGTIGIDATHFKATEKGTTRDGRLISSEPDGGPFKREKDPIDKRPPKIKGRRESNKYIYKWAYEATFVTTALPGSDPLMPRPILGMAVHRPNRSPGDMATAAMQNLLEHDVPRNYVAADRAYFPKARQGQLQMLLRKAGYRIVASQVKGFTGLQADYKGAKLVDGNWYGACLPKELETATTDLIEGRIGPRLWEIRIRRRARYLLRPKQAPSASGNQKWLCPGQGAGATCACPWRRTEALEKNRKREAEGGQPTKDKQLSNAGELAQVTALPAYRDALCSNSAGLTIPLEAGASFAQQGPQWGTPEWHDIYVYPRQTIESKNNAIKNGSGELLGERTRRLMRGIHNQGLVVALLVVAHNIRVLKQYLRNLKRFKLAPPPKRHNPAPPPKGQNWFDQIADDAFGDHQRTWTKQKPLNQLTTESR